MDKKISWLKAGGAALTALCGFACTRSVAEGRFSTG
jgi:hypothetical protein